MKLTNFAGALYQIHMPQRNGIQNFLEVTVSRYSPIAKKLARGHILFFCTYCLLENSIFLRAPHRFLPPEPAPTHTPPIAG